MRALNQSEVSGVYEGIHEYEAINVKPPSSTAIQQWPLSPPALPGTAKDKDVELTSCPAYIPTSFLGKPSDGADRQYVNMNVGQSSSSRKAAEGEYEKVHSSLIKEEVSEVGQISSGEAEARGEYENVGQK